MVYPMSEFCITSIYNLYIYIHTHACMHACAYIREREHSHPRDSMVKRKFDLGPIVSTPALVISKTLISVLMTYMSCRWSHIFTALLTTITNKQSENPVNYCDTAHVQNLVFSTEHLCQFTSSQFPSQCRQDVQWCLVSKWAFQTNACSFKSNRSFAFDNVTCFKFTSDIKKNMKSTAIFPPHWTINIIKWTVSSHTKKKKKKILLLFDWFLAC